MAAFGQQGFQLLVGLVDSPGKLRPLRGLLEGRGLILAQIELGEKLRVGLHRQDHRLHRFPQRGGKGVNRTDQLGQLALKKAVPHFCVMEIHCVFLLFIAEYSAKEIALPGLSLA